jgi:methionyl-tRNA synthetase
MPKFYITTPIFYPNANLHMGHAYTVTLCDILARAHKLQNQETYFLTGSDENTGKILKTIEEQNQNVEEYLSGVAEAFKDLYSKLDISYDQFIRTSDKEKHWPGAMAMWKKLVEAGDIYKSKYSGLYCVGCETFYTEKDLVDGKCPIHMTVPEKIEEENYFFRLSKYTETLKQKIGSDEIKIVPETRKNEIMSLFNSGLEDVSFSRPKQNVPHGIPVPGDPEQVIYVWCDALVNYISALGFGSSDDSLFKKFWPVDVHVIGKDILRFHAALWPAMLLSVGLELPKSILVHGLITSGGVKMSKTLGNVISPHDLISEYGSEAVRYYLARHISTFEDGDLTMERFKESYNAHLANGLGNLTSRIMKMAEGNLIARFGPLESSKEELPKEFTNHLENFEINKACDFIWQEIGEMDKFIQDNQPFKLVKDESTKVQGVMMIQDLTIRLYKVARMLNPIMPQTSAAIKALINQNKTPDQPLFVRKD